MPKFLVSAEARLEWTLDAEDEDLAIQAAKKIFRLGGDIEAVSLLEWEATDITEDRPI